MIPEFFDGKFLPDGDHVATWEEVADRFGANPKRRGFCERLIQFLRQGKRCGFLKVYLFGSFISANDDPGDVDLLWVHRKDLDKSLLPRRCQELLDYQIMKAQEGWDMWCCSDDPFVINYLMAAWRKDKGPDRTPRGVILLELATL